MQRLRGHCRCRPGVVLTPDKEFCAHPLFGIQTTPPDQHPALLSAPELILVVTMPGVAETFQTDID